jgi:acetyl-CoA carboxylase biotin carboxyl carrier protein
MMDLDEIRLILELMREHDLAEFELERDNIKLRLRKSGSGGWTASAPPLPQASFVPAVVAPAAAQPAVAAPGPVLTAGDEEDVDLAIVKSPIVGTFYRSSEPGAKAFVEMGQMVRQGQVLCIIEAMKLMNEITADCDGEVVKVYVENGHAVQYGERLFAIKPS